MQTFAEIASRALTACAATDPTPPSTCSVPPSRGRTIPKEVHRIVAELGLRYRPTYAADLEAHRARLALLAEDLADAPPALLEDAVREWARASRFMPTAAELVTLMRAALDAADRQPPPASASLAAAYNAARLTGRDDLQWIGTGDSLRLVPIAEARRLHASAGGSMGG